MWHDGAKLRWANRQIHSDHVFFGEVLFARNGRCKIRGRNHYELLAFHSGSARCHSAGGDLELGIGKTYLLRPGKSVQLRFTGARETHYSYCGMKTAFVPPVMRSNLTVAATAVPRSESFEHLLLAVFRMRRPEHPASQRLIESLALSMFDEYLHAASIAALQPSPNAVLSRFLEYVQDHLAEETCLDQALRHAGVSRNTLINKLRAERQTTPARYLWRTRLERGLAMLGQTGRTVGEIAYHCGFKSPFHFSRLVKEHLGYSPRQLRARVGEK
jgi:AraC-like DNA-binding protein